MESGVRRWKSSGSDAMKTEQHVQLETVGLFVGKQSYLFTNREQSYVSAQVDEVL